MEEASKDLLQMEESKPSRFESSLFVCKKRDTEIEDARMKAKREKKNPSAEISAFPPSGVIGRVKDFLGAIAEANEKLQTAVQESGCENYDIEALTGNEKEYIELDLLLGLTDLQTPEAVAAAEATMKGTQGPLPLYASQSSSSSEDGSDEEEEVIEEDSLRPAGPGRGKKRPNITVLD